jgi:hypothetical protein
VRTVVRSGANYKGDSEMKISEVWYDGKCKKCGSIVYETQCGDEDGKALEMLADYKNACSNESCEENKWHYVGDQEFLDYYEHI